MPSKHKSLKSKKKKYSNDDNDDEETFQNSEDEYAAQSESDEESQSGGEAPDVDPESELDNDNSNLDIDPDDEKDPIEDDKYDPVNETEEDLEDPDEETDIDEDVVDEGDEGEVEEVVEAEGEGAEGEGFVAEARQCHLKNLNKDFIVLDEDDSNIYGKMESKKIPKEERISDPVMTYYELVRIIGTRAQQFNLGAEPLVKGIEHLHPAKMAYVELISKMTPYIIRRHLPGKRYEEWEVGELDIIHSITDDFFVPENFDWNTFMIDVNEIKGQLNDAQSQVSRIKQSNQKKTSKKTVKK